MENNNVTICKQCREPNNNGYQYCTACHNKHRGIDITYDFFVEVPEGIVLIPADGSIRAIRKAGIESVAITEAARKYPKIVGYAVRECDLAKLKPPPPNPDDGRLRGVEQGTFQSSTVEEAA
jgi:hypothetical protein